MSRLKETIKGDRFAVLYGGERPYESASRGACLSYLQGKVERAKGDAAGTVIFDPVLGGDSTVYLVRKNGRTTRTEVVNDII